MTKLPVWLYPDGTERGRLQATACSVDLSVDALPKASITIPSADEIPNTHDFVEIFTEHGSAGVFRVVSSSYKYGNSCQLQLIGAADTLSDDVWTASEEETTRSASEWMRQVLNHQTTRRWKFGRCELAANWKTSVNYPELWDMLESIRALRVGYRWDFDFSTSPWTLSLVKMPDTVAAEFRISRNVDSAQITVSDQNMANRLIFTVTDGNNDGTPLVRTYNDAASQQKYGIRTRCTDIKTDEIPAGLTAEQYARQLLAEHAVPDYSVQITGADLSKITGMDFDHFQLGYLCNAVLPEYGETVQERIVALSYPNVLAEPHNVRVTLNTQLNSITGSIADARRVASSVKTAARRGGGGSKADTNSWSKVLTDVIEAADGTGLKELWQTGITMDAHGGIKLFSLYQGLSSLDSHIEINNQAITSEVTRATAEEGRLSSSITQNAEQIRLKVSKGDVSTQLSVECGNVTISGTPGQGGNLVVDGYVTASQLSAQKARIDNILSGVTVADHLKAKSASLGTANGGVVNIYGQQVRVYTITDDYGTARHVFGYT